MQINHPNDGVYSVTKRNSGFTLIETMIVVTIVAIVASIAIPNYMEYLRKTRRNDAMATLQQFANAMERYRLTNGNYLNANAAVLPSAPRTSIFGSTAPQDGGTAYYNLTIEAPLTATTYTLRATPIAGRSQAFDGIIELDSTGAQWWDEANDGFDVGVDDNWVPG